MFFWKIYDVLGFLNFLYLPQPHKGTKTFLTNGISPLFINGKQAVINGLRKLRDPPS